MNCPSCGSQEIRCMANMTVSFPLEYFYYGVSKKAIRKKEFKILGVDWADCDLTCSKCGYTVSPRDINKPVMVMVNPEDLEQKEVGN